MENNLEPAAMYRIRFHGRGGQGMKTASRILGTAFFLEGFIVQDAPRYGAERRGAPIFAYVRASREPVHERGVIHNPDLVVIADESLFASSSPEILSGVTSATAILIRSDQQAGMWRERLAIAGTALTLPTHMECGDMTATSRFIGVSCASAAARLTGVISRHALEQVIRNELSRVGDSLMATNLDLALHSYDIMAPMEGCVTPGGEIFVLTGRKPEWVDLVFERADLSAPVIFNTFTSKMVKTGLWRTVRPVIDHAICIRCRLCEAYCPDGCICLDGTGCPRIDYEHCKGCLVCMAECPPRAIKSIPEHEGQKKRGAK